MPVQGSPARQITPRLVTLKTRREFLDIKDKGKKFRAGWLTASCLSREELEPKFGWVLPRYVGGAVIRNRLRRWLKAKIRERLVREQIQGKSLCFVFQKAQPGFYKSLEFKDFEKAFDSVWSAINKKK